MAESSKSTRLSEEHQHKVLDVALQRHRHQFHKNKQVYCASTKHRQCHRYGHSSPCTSDTCESRRIPVGTSCYRQGPDSSTAHYHLDCVDTASNELERGEYAQSHVTQSALDRTLGGDKCSSCLLSVRTKPFWRLTVHDPGTGSTTYASFCNRVACKGTALTKAHPEEYSTNLVSVMNPPPTLSDLTAKQKGGWQEDAVQYAQDLARVEEDVLSADGNLKMAQIRDDQESKNQKIVRDLLADRTPVQGCSGLGWVPESL